MIRLAIIVAGLASAVSSAYGQDLPPTIEQKLENLTDVEQAEPEDDSYLQQLVYFRRYPMNLNTVTASELKELRIVSDLQADNLIAYRRLFGNLVHIYELQAIPTWDITTIRKLLPFIMISSPFSYTEDLWDRLRAGDHSLLFRVSQVLEESKGFDKSTQGTKYLGSPQRLFFRYQYVYKNLLQFGMVGDKDAGEQFFKGAQSRGFDFYSFHLFARKAGIIQAMAIGDFTVNMGQGLIQWQSLAFKKSVDVMGIKRQSPVLRPFNSAGEIYFHRGAGITIRKGNIEATAFASFRKIDANHVADTLTDEDFVSSFQTSGYHRTPAEIADRKKLGQIAYGGNLKYYGNLSARQTGRFHIGINGICYNFSLPVKKEDEPYNLYAINGSKWYNLSADYSYTYKNIHFFGEAATDKNFNTAFINGLLISVDPRADISLLHRSIRKEYQAVNGNAFTENNYPTNEHGFYAGINIRPSAMWRLDMYADIYKFPWLKYQVDAPSYGTDFLAQLTCFPNRQTEIFVRYRTESKQSNEPDNLTVVNFLTDQPRQNLRVHFTYRITSSVVIRSRAEMTWYNKEAKSSEKGFLSFFDFIYRPLLKPYAGTLRLQYFETDGYDSRLYAYENDVLYSYSIPSFFDKGFRYYLALNRNFPNRIAIWLRWAQTVYRGKESIGSGLDEIPGNTKSELKFQIRYIF